MRTMIARLKHEESDLLGDSQNVEVRRPEERRAMYQRIDEQFKSTASPVMQLLGDQFAQTRADFGPVLESASAGDLDILSSVSPITTGVASYEALLPSHAVVMTCTEDVVAQVAQLPEVERIHENFIYEVSHPELDVLAGVALSGRGAWHHTRVGLAQARAKATGKGVKVAVLDTGIHEDHPEFAGVTVESFMEWDELGIPVADSVRRDTHGHGTQVCSLLCGQHLGIAPEVELNVGLIAPRGRTTFAQLNQGLDWAARSGFDIVSLSVGKPGYRNEMEDFIRFADQAGILICAAIGNSGPDTHRSPGDYQAVFGVGATDAEDAVWDRSAGGKISVGGLDYAKPDIFAPGKGVWTAEPPNRYVLGSGTSFATPIVAGVAALVAELKPDLTVGELRSHLLRNCDAITLSGPAGSQGFRISASRAVAAGL